MLSRYKNYFEKHLANVAESIAWISPNALTIIGIIPQALFFYLMQRHAFGYAAIALLFSFIDMLDGMVARRTHRVTAFGGVLDSTLDRVSDFLIIAGFYVSGLVPIGVASGLLLASFLTSYIRSRAELASHGQITFNQGLIERPERIIYLFVVLVLHFPFPSSTLFLIRILVLLSFLTVGQRLWAAYRKLNSPRG